MNATLTILGIETSCDETAAAVVRRHPDGSGDILANVVHSQIDDHAAYGGVVPEIAARAHVALLDGIVARAMAEAGQDYADLDGVAATAGPGLVGGLIAGLLTAKSIALVHDLPLLAINHLEAHALTAGLTDGVQPPYAMLLVSGGHTQVLAVAGVGQYHRIASTIDDALGEAFDKTAKLLGLGFPGGPAVETWAAQGDDTAFDFPRPMRGREEPHFSFAGLKTAVRQAAQEHEPLCDADIANICASFQAAVCDCVADRLLRALELHRDMSGSEARTLVVAGGVAANAALRARLEQVCDQTDYRLIVPPPELCTDNGAMIAWAGAERLARGLIDEMDVPVRSRWPLDEAAVPLVGGGKRGGKA